LKPEENQFDSPIWFGDIIFYHRKTAMITIKRPEATILIEPLENGKFQYQLKNLAPGLGVQETSFESFYGEKVAQAILDMEGVYRLVKELRREEGPFGMEKALRYYTLSFLPEEDFAGKRLLDFACGCGSSTMALSRIFPDTFITGIDRMEDCIHVCNLKKEQLGLERVSFIASTSDTRLPDSLEQIDHCIICASYEHFLPSERRPLLHDIWGRLPTGGVLFICQTPHRYSPIGTHGARVPMLNYLPDSLAFRIDRWIAKDWHGQFTDEEILRAGFRGGSMEEIGAILQETDFLPFFLEPNRLGVKDSIHLWMLTKDISNLGTLKRIYGAFCRVFKTVTGLTIEPYVNLAIRKTGPTGLK